MELVEVHCLKTKSQWRFINILQLYLIRKWIYITNTSVTVPNMWIHEIYCRHCGDFEDQVVLRRGTLCSL